MGKIVIDESFWEKREKELADYERSLKVQEKRREAWNQNECKSIYNKILEYCGGLEVVRPGMRAHLKEAAINCFLKNTQPDFEELKRRVETANKIFFERKKSGYYKRRHRYMFAPPIKANHRESRNS